MTENPVEEQPAAEAPDTVLEQLAPADPPAHVERITFETGYRGFLILTCEACGKSYTVNAREPVTETTCKACGHVTPWTAGGGGHAVPGLREDLAVQDQQRAGGRVGTLPLLRGNDGQRVGPEAAAVRAAESETRG